MGAVEDEIPRIDAPIANKGAGLARAAAWISRVQKPTLLAHEALDLLPRSSELLPECVSRGVQDRASDDIGNLEDLPEDKHEPLLAIEAEQHAEHAAKLCFLDEHAGVGQLRFSIEAEGFIRRRAPEVTSETLKAVDRLLWQWVHNGGDNQRWSLIPASALPPRADANRMFAVMADLAGQGYRGRLAGTPENARAVAAVEGLFKEIGLAPAGNNGTYRQRFVIPVMAPISSPSCVTSEPTSPAAQRGRFRGSDANS